VKCKIKDVVFYFHFRTAAYLRVSKVVKGEAAAYLRVSKVVKGETAAYLRVSRVKRYPMPPYQPWNNICHNNTSIYSLYYY
jgi:hypothetical protein